MGKHPWLSPLDPSVQAIPGLSRISHDFLPADYRRDAERFDVVATVHVEALWAGDPVGETRWLETLDKGSGIAARYVANVALGTPSSAALIAAQATFERVLGVRGILSCHPDPAKSFVADPNLAYDPAWRDDVARLVGHGLHLELMMYPYQAEAVDDLAAAMPDLQIVINHCGSPVDRDAAGLHRWRDGIARIARRPNVAIKVSNPGVYDPGWTLDSVRDVAMHCIDNFGPDRAMFGTDCPVSYLQMTYDQVYDTFGTIAAVFSEGDQAKLFHGNAERSNCSPPHAQPAAPEWSGSPSRVQRMASMARIERRRAVSMTERMSA